MIKSFLVIVVAGVILASGCGMQYGTIDEAVTEDETMVDVWSIEDEFELLNELNKRICEKIGAEDNFEKLTEEEKIFFILWQMEAEVNNGGFSQFFFNSAGNFANEAEAACRKIGADNMAEICKKALDAYGGKLPEDWTERQEFMEEMESDEISEILDECDSEFYDYPDDLGGLLYKFVMENKEKFQ